MACVCADGSQFAHAAVFCGVCETSLPAGVSTQDVYQLMLLGYMTFWHRDASSVDATILLQWIDIFIQRIGVRVSVEKTVLLLYDSVRSHMTFGFIKKIFDGKIVVIALPSHTSDNLQHFDVSFLCPFKTYI